MNPADILKYGHSFFLNSVAVVLIEHVNEPGACGRWSVKDLVAHLTSYEWVLVDILENLIAPGPTPMLDAYRAAHDAFNDEQVDQRAALTLEQALAEYHEAYGRVQALLPRLPAAHWRRTGLLAWYGAEYDLEDFIVYTYYGHKREHGGQIQVFRDRFE